MSHYHDQCCGEAKCGCHSSGCDENDCCSTTSSCCRGSSGHAGKFLELADAAWVEVLKGKIIEHILANHSKHLDELAALISEANHERWHKKLSEKHCHECFEDKLKAFFSRSCTAHGQSCAQNQHNHK